MKINNYRQSLSTLLGVIEPGPGWLQVEQTGYNVGLPPSICILISTVLAKLHRKMGATAARTLTSPVSFLSSTMAVTTW